MAAGVRHFVYLSVAQPAPVMKTYQRIRADVEAYLAHSAIPATIVRPWYVLGPGHRWPVLLMPAYALAERLPFARAIALRLGLVTIDQMLVSLVDAIERPPSETRVLDVPAIRAARLVGECA